MADMELKCKKCGNRIMISEFADLDAIFCRNCGARMEAIDEKPSAQAGSALRVRPAQAEVAEAPRLTGEDLSRFSRRTNQPGSPKHSAAGVIVGWVLFLVLASVMWALRYGHMVTSPYLERVFRYGPYCFIVMHIVITLKAFRDSVFSGTLCLLVPFYSMYYLFLVSDDFILRAVVAGLLVGIGQDTAVFFQATATTAVDAVHRWILVGG